MDGLTREELGWMREGVVVKESEEVHGHTLTLTPLGVGISTIDAL